MTGIANSEQERTTSIIHMNTGMRISVMPGARMLRIVTMKLTADAVDAMPSMMQADGPEVGSCPGEPRSIGVLVSGA